MPADSLRKAMTPEPFSTSRTSNWVARNGGLPPYVQHIAHDLMEKRGKDEQTAIRMAIGIVKRWARGGGNVDAGTKAAASLAVSQWMAMRGRAAATRAGAPVREADLLVLEAVGWAIDALEARPWPR